MSAGWVALGAALCATAFAQLSYKIYFRRESTKYLLTAVVCFLGATVCSYLALHSLSIGTVYMSTALTQLMVVGLANRVLGEPLTRDHRIAMALIVSGILVYTA